ncbi:hypothetical protein BDW69DRAFT_154428 [Aspergillus filifer]
MRLIIRILPPASHLLKRLCIRGPGVLGLELVDLIFHVEVVLGGFCFGFDDGLLVLFVVVGWDCCVHFVDTLFLVLGFAVGGRFWWWFGVIDSGTNLFGILS